MTHPETASLSEFAGIAKFKPSYITQLKKDDRLVLTPDGKRVRVAESLDRIAATKDPSRIGVVRRHAAERAAPLSNAAPSPEPEADRAQEPPEPPDGNSKGNDSGFQYWRERSERARALQAERENLIADGKLLLADDVIAVSAHAVSILRTRMESLADILAPQVVGARDEAKARALIADAHEHALAELSRQFGTLAKEST
ncbi:MAG: hypothetical protein ACREPT_00355 [Rudaea sp.]